MSSIHTKRIIFPYLLTLSIGVLLSCILMNAITLTFPGGVPNPWVSLGTPPVAIKSIVDASWRQVLVEAQDGSLFFADITFWSEDEGDGLYWEWKPVKVLADTDNSLSSLDFPTTRGDDCEKLHDGIIPSNPKGQIVECVYAYELGAEYREDGYFALISDGNILYWHGGNNAIATQLNFICSTFIFPIFMAVIISVLYWFMHIIRRDAKEM